MSGYLTNQVLSPPDLPPYLESVYKLKPIVGEPSDEEVIGIHAIIRVASKVVDVQGMGDPLLLFRLSEHLFNAQMAKYRSRYLRAVFPENTTYTPPTLPAHVTVNLEPVTGVPSDEAIMKVQDTIRGYQQFSNAPSMFDPPVNMNLSQHLFDLQMARYTQRARQSHLISVPRDIASSTSARTIQRTDNVAEQNNKATDNVAAESDVFGVDQSTQRVADTEIWDAIDRSNRLTEQGNHLAERTNMLIERSNQIAERANQLTERCNQPVEQSNSLVERFIELFGKLNEHFEQSNRLAELSTKPVEKLEEALRDISRVLAKIQHAIVRNHKGNTGKAADCLTNEKGYTPGGVESHFGNFEHISI
ncbi:hypothetical protein RSAG8_10762, partial [Rhizoctonia solani AG-8 WAC10335]